MADELPVEVEPTLDILNTLLSPRPGALWVRVVAFLGDGSQIIVSPQPANRPVYSREEAASVAFDLMDSMLAGATAIPEYTMGLYLKAPISPSRLSIFSRKQQRAACAHPDVAGLMLVTADYWRNTAWRNELM